MSFLRLKDFLDKRAIPYLAISHSLAYTAQGTAALAHIPGQEVAKTVIVRIDGRLAMAVVPALAHVDLDLLRKAAHAKEVALAGEEEFRDRFPDCELGAMPPFGNLYGMDVFADENLTKDRQIAFNAGSHRELIQMSWADVERLVEPRIVRLTSRPKSDRAA